MQNGLTEGIKLKLVLSLLLLLRIYIISFGFTVIAIHFPTAWKKRRTFLISLYFSAGVIGIGVLLRTIYDLMFFL